MSADCIPCQTDATGRRISDAPRAASCSDKENTFLSRCVRPILIATVVLGGSAFAAEPRITAEIDATPEGVLTAEEQRAVSLAAGRLLRHTYNATVALEQADTESAAEEIALAETLVQIIERAVPSATVVAKISAGKLTYEEKDTVKPTVIPIHYELDMVSLTAPLNRARMAQQSQESDEPAPLGVIEHELRDIRVSIDLEQAKAGLQTAKEGLAAEDVTLARQGLAATLHHSLRFSAISVDVPIHRAQENLMLARAALEQGRGAQARALLAEVTESLNAYRPTTGGTETIDAIREEISDFAEGLADGVPEAGFGETIDAWWDRLGELAR